MKRLLAALALVFVVVVLSVRATDAVPFEGGAFGVVWGVPDRSYASFDSTPFTSLASERIDWNPVNGFQIPERAHHEGWLTILYAAREGDYVYASRITYAQVVRGVETGDVYLIVTDSLREFVASYGGANAWHTRGMYRVSGDAWDAAVRALKALVTA